MCFVTRNNHANDCNDCAVDSLKQPESVQIALVFLSSHFKYVAAAIGRFHIIPISVGCSETLHSPNTVTWAVPFGEAVFLKLVQFE